MSDRAALEALVERFTDAFNRDDLDAVMAFMADDAVYDEFDGTRSVGRDAIRKSFEPQFAGAFGTIRFHNEDVFVDAEQGKVLTRWVCSLERDGRRREWRGLDILRIQAGRITEKHTYAKTRRLDLRDV